MKKEKKLKRTIREDNDKQLRNKEIYHQYPLQPKYITNWWMITSNQCQLTTTAFVIFTLFYYQQ